MFGMSLITATGHAVFSAALGFGIAAIGFAFSKVISLYISYAVGTLMVAFGLFIGVRALVSKKKREVTPGEKLLKRKESENGSRLRSLSYFAVLGAALSPDLSITPIFLGAIPVGIIFALYLFVVFVATSIIAQLILVQLGAKGLAKTLERIPEKYNDSIVGFVIAAIGIYVVLAV